MTRNRHHKIPTPPNELQMKYDAAMREVVRLTEENSKLKQSAPEKGNSHLIKKDARKDADAVSRAFDIGEAINGLDRARYGMVIGINKIADYMTYESGLSDKATAERMSAWLQKIWEQSGQHPAAIILELARQLKHAKDHYAPIIERAAPGQIRHNVIHDAVKFALEIVKALEKALPPNGDSDQGDRGAALRTLFNANGAQSYREMCDALIAATPRVGAPTKDILRRILNKAIERQEVQGQSRADNVTAIHNDLASRVDKGTATPAETEECSYLDNLTDAIGSTVKAWGRYKKEKKDIMLCP